jgi:glycerophosphoryl diester phosphodiesterase
VTQRPGRQWAVLDEPGPLAIAHRGGATYPPNLGVENSFVAFRRAVEMGYRWLETDVHVSRDGVVFAFHDATLMRLTGEDGSVADLDADTVLRARIGGTEPVPTLHGLLEAFPQARFNIDVKDDRAVQPLVELLGLLDAWDRVCLASFSQRRLLRLRRAAPPGAATSAGPAEVAALRVTPPWLPAWVDRAATRPLPVSVWDTLACVQVPVRVGTIPLATAGFLRAAHARGLAVHVWTIDDPDEMHRLLELGVDGLITDRIDVLKDVLVARGQWSGAA